MTLISVSVELRISSTILWLTRKLKLLFGTYNYEEIKSQKRLNSLEFTAGSLALLYMMTIL